MIAKIIATEQLQTKQLLNDYLHQQADLKLPSNGPNNFKEWLEFLTSFIKNELNEARTVVVQTSSTHNNSSRLANNHQNDINDDTEEEEEVEGDTATNGQLLSSATVNGGAAGDFVVIGGTNNGSSEVLLLQNAQLQKSLDEYKNIVADTVSTYNSF